MQPSKLKLPRPDEFGTYWFRSLVEDGTRAGDVPAIMESQRVKPDKITQRGWMVQLGRRGMLWDGPDVELFESPNEAFQAMKQALAV